MEFLQHLVLTILTTLLIFFAISSLVLKKHKHYNNNKSAPECGGAWPIVGHIPLLAGSSKLPHEVFAALADTYGPIFTLRIGLMRVVVVSSPALASECLVTNERAVLGRPTSVAMELVCYNGAMYGFGPYGTYWRRMNKIAMLELLSNRRLGVLSHVWRAEIEEAVKGLHGLWATKKGHSGQVLVDLQQKFSELAMNIIIRIISGKKFGVDRKEEEGFEFNSAIREFMEHMGSFTIGDALPFLRWLDLGGQEKAMRRTFRKLDNILQKWLDEHKRKGPKEIDQQDFMDVMLGVIDDETTKYCNFDVDTIIKATCLSMIAGGSDTTPVTLTWAISLLLNNPEVLKKAQDELVTQVGIERQVEESDIPHLVYLQAIVKETLRMHPPGALIPREFIEDCTIGGYHIKSGTRLILNIYKIFHDPQIWGDPLEFRPERFLTTTHKDVDFRGKNFDFIPFGAGRRMCPGMSFGLRVVHLALASFLHAFELSTPSDAPIDMKEKFGLTSIKAEPLEVLIAPKLSCHAY